jgi:Kef-type K+ transport system membrane component KefB
MGLAGLLLRFAVAYVVLALVVGVGLGAAGVRAHPAINMAVLLASVTWACLSFAQKNRRYLTRPEKTRVVAGMIAVDVGLQLGVLALMPPLRDEPEAGTRLWAGLGGLFTFVALLHAAAIYWFVGWAGRLHARQAARHTATAPPPPETP